MARYIRWSLAAILLVLVWQHSHWAIALSLTALFVEGELMNHLTILALNDLFLYSSEFWRVRLCPSEAGGRLVIAKRLYQIASKERLKALKNYNDAVGLCAASLERKRAVQFEDERRDYDRRIQEAMNKGTPEGARDVVGLQHAKEYFESESIRFPDGTYSMPLPTVVKVAKECLEIAEEKVNRACENLKAAGGE